MFVARCNGVWPSRVSSLGSIASGITQWKSRWLIIAILLGHGSKVHLEDNEPDATSPARCHTQATNSEFLVGRVYFGVPLDLAQLDADVDVQDKFYSISQCIWHCTTEMPRLVSPFESITTSNAQPKREAASVQVYHDGSWSTPRRCAGVFAVECVIKDLRSDKTSVTILEYQSSLVGSSLLPHPGAEDKPRNSLSQYTLLFLECSWERAPRTTIWIPLK